MKFTLEKFYKSYMLDLAKVLFPLNRSLTGDGNRKTLKILKEKNSNLVMKSVKSGTKVFDWKIPNEWKIEDAFIQDIDTKKKYAEFKKNNLHVVGYSSSINKIIKLNKLKKKIYTDEKNSRAIPYVTSYYKKDWGFCMSKSQLKNLKKKKYRAVIKSKFLRGKMDYGEYLIKGKSKKELFISTYICHPSMANNELSGPVISSALMDYVNKFYKKPNYSYRFIFVPETIGSIFYINKNLKNLKKNMLAGFVINCAGDDRSYSFVHTPNKDTLADLIMESSFLNLKKKKIYSFKDRSSDERQYCSPGVELPVCSFSRSKAGSKFFPEYHTSLDNFNVVTKEGLFGSFKIFKRIIDCFENSLFPISTFKCEPFLSKRNLYPHISKKTNYSQKTKNITDIIAYSNGTRSIFEISKILNLDLVTILHYIDLLKKKKLIK